MEPAPPTTTPPRGTSVHTSVSVEVGSQVTASDNPHSDDLICLRFDGQGVTLMGDLDNVERIIDEAAHQLALIRAKRAENEEDWQAQRAAVNVPRVNGLRQAAADARAEAVG